MKPRSGPDQDRFASQRRKIVWILVASATFLGANAWFIVHMMGPID